MRSIVQGLYQSVGTLNKELRVSESINVVNSVKIDNLQNDLKKEKKITRSLRAKVDSLHRRKAIDILSVKKENKYLHQILPICR